jgi:hypothetical protein
MLPEKALKHKDEVKKDIEGNSFPQPSGRYTIFHALFEALKEKDRKHKKKY